MKIKAGFVKREIMGETVVVPTGEAANGFRGMIKLNGTAREIWDAVEAGKTEEEIVARFVSDYEIDRETAEKDVKAILQKMQEAGIFEA